MKNYIDKYFIQTFIYYYFVKKKGKYFFQYKF